MEGLGPVLKSLPQMGAFHLARRARFERGNVDCPDSVLRLRMGMPSLTRGPRVELEGAMAGIVLDEGFSRRRRRAGGRRRAQEDSRLARSRSPLRICLRLELGDVVAIWLVEVACSCRPSFLLGRQALDVVAVEGAGMGSIDSRKGESVDWSRRDLRGLGGR